MKEKLLLLPSESFLLVESISLYNKATENTLTQCLWWKLISESKIVYHKALGKGGILLNTMISLTLFISQSLHFVFMHFVI